jgi:hypothetical protein
MLLGTADCGEDGQISPPTMAQQIACWLTIGILLPRRSRRWRSTFNLALFVSRVLVLRPETLLGSEDAPPSGPQSATA